MSTEGDVAKVIVEALPDLIEFIIDAVKGGKIDPLRARQLLEDEMTRVADAEMRKELGP